MTHLPSNSPAVSRKRRRDPRATRDRLVRAALDLFTTQGYHASTTPQIAARAGVAEGTIYRHFDSKEHLLNELYRAALRLLIKEVRDVPAAMRCAERLERIGDAWRRLAARDGALITLVFATRVEPLLDAKSKDTYRELKDEIAKIIASGKAAGDVRPGPVEVWTETWMALMVLVLVRTASKEWNPQHPAPGQVQEAAWDAIRSTSSAL